MYSRFSPAFVEACRKGEFRKGEKMPCPKCGHEDVVFTDPRGWLKYAGIAGLAGVVLFLLHLNTVGQVAFVAAGLVAAASFGSEPSYKCNHCDHIWRFRDAEKWAEAVRHDEKRAERS